MDFQHSVSELDEVTKNVTVSITEDQMKGELNQQLKGIARNANIKGFRKGKAPIHLIEKMYGERARFEVAQRLINGSLREVIEKESIEYIGEPDVDIKELEKGKGLTYEAKLYLKPEPKVSGYDSIEVEVPKQSTSDKQVNDAVEEFRRSRAATTPVEESRPIQSGEVAHMQLEVRMEGSEESSQEPFVAALGDGILPEDLEKGIEGMQPGETKEIEGVVPDTHKDPQLRGKPARYIVTLEKISTRELPELDDEFAKSLDFGADSLLDLRLKIREQLEEQSQEEEKGEIQARILDSLLESNQFAVPQGLIDEEIRDLLVRNGGIDPNKHDPRRISVEPFREGLGPIAEKRVRTTVLVDRIGAQEGIEFSDAEWKEKLEEMASQSGMPSQELERFLTQDERMEAMTQEFVRGKVLDYLVEKAKVRYVEEAAAAGDADSKTAET